MAGDLNAKHVDWNSRLNTRRGKLLRDYADEISCMIFGPDSPTRKPIQPLGYSRCLEIVITKNLSFSVYLTSCSALSSDYLSVLIETSCRSSFHNPPDRPDFRRSDWANFQTRLEELIPFVLRWVLFRRRSDGSGSGNPKLRLHDDSRPPIPTVIQEEIAWKTGYGDSGRSARTLLWKPRSPASRGRWPAGLTGGESTSGALHSTPSILKPKRCGGWPSGWWISYSIYPQATPFGIALSDSEKLEALADNLEA